MKVPETRNDIKTTLKERKEHDDIEEDEEEEMKNGEIEYERKEIDEEREDTEEKRPVRKRKMKEDISTTVSVQTTAQEKERTRRESEVNFFVKDNR